MARTTDGIHVTFLTNCEFAHVGEGKWISTSVARDLIEKGTAVESDPTQTLQEVFAMLYGK